MANGLLDSHPGPDHYRAMAGGSSILEYVENMRGLIRQNPALFGMMVDRQVQARVLPRVEGSRTTLEPELWALLVFCADGPESEPPELTDELYEKAREAVHNGTRLDGSDRASYPRAARAVASTLDTLREHGVFPPPKI